jgi:hypothetical protein
MVNNFEEGQGSQRAVVPVMMMRTNTFSENQKEYKLQLFH